MMTIVQKLKRKFTKLILIRLRRNDFALNASKLFLYREYPAGDLLTINATSGNNSLFNSKTSRNLVFKIVLKFLNNIPSNSNHH